MEEAQERVRELLAECGGDAMLAFRRAHTRQIEARRDEERQLWKDVITLLFLLPHAQDRRDTVLAPIAGQNKKRRPARDITARKPSTPF
ncbi:MAG: hypothetical protein FKY71_07785 [Spiribacter salinus]|uniref:Uncharacterized protein n=1 Tax=Spiribacter salinus TaxID=1335746 RepID=A0A540VS66_9GAMM|nr:MAG: hypothetical protein FKY71_07785 [Spiribacter salinus]